MVNFDENRIKRDVEEAYGKLIEKRKGALDILKKIEFSIEKTFYDEYNLIDQYEVKQTEEKEEQEVQNIEDEMFLEMEKEEERWFNNQIDATKKVSERKEVTHRYIKDPRKPLSENKTEKSGKRIHSNLSSKNDTLIRPGSSARRKLDEARSFK